MKLETHTEPKPKAKHQPHKEQPLSAADHPDAQLKADTVCALTGLGKSTLYKLARLKEFPTPIKRGLRCTRWRAGDVTDWLKAQAAQVAP
ncbi:MAG: AlpA family phage regulatory protein [Rhodoferax sp.]